MDPLISNNYTELWAQPGIESRIEEGIRNNRQSDAVVRITDFFAKPLPGVKVRVQQHDSSFHFGANIFMLGGYADEGINCAYEDAFCSLFNAATVPLYWRTLEPEQGCPRYSNRSVPIARRPPPDRVVDFGRQRGLRMHGHTLVWKMRKWSVPDWLPEDPAAAAPFWEKRIRENSERYGSQIKRWDVLNEAVANYRGLGQPMLPDYEDQAFRWAEQYLPAARLDINETTNAWGPSKLDYTRLIERLLTAKRRLGAIGMQFHVFSDENLADVLSGHCHRPEDLFMALDHYAQFKLPLHISEITLTSPGNTPEGMEAQAEVARNFYRLWFSHPSVEGITWWNLPDGGAAPGENKVFSGLLFGDMRTKPAYEVLQELIHREWRTQEQGVTDSDGFFRFRGFHGSYLIRTESGNADSGMQSAITLEPGKTAMQRIRL